MKTANVKNMWYPEHMQKTLVLCTAVPAKAHINEHDNDQRKNRNQKEMCPVCFINFYNIHFLTFRQPTTP